MSPCRTIFTSIAACLIPLGAPGGEILNLGDPAPSLAVSEWVKGEKIERFEPGKIYVVEFWATYCGPCRTSIAHLTELARRYKEHGVQFLGVDVWERDPSSVKQFVNEMGDKMDFSVALDDVPEKGDPEDGAMAKTWMRAAEENRIPTDFVVRDGKIAWIGHPTELDAPLAGIVAGKWDAGITAGTRLVAKTKERKAAVVRRKVWPLYREGNYKAVLTTIEQATSGDLDLAEELAAFKFQALCNGGDVDAGLELGARLLETHKDEPKILNSIFWGVIDPQLWREPDPRVARIALQAARRAVELTKGENIAQLDTLAVALYRTGDAHGAVATEEIALKRLEAEGKNSSYRYFKQLFEERLERYRKAVSEKAPRR